MNHWLLLDIPAFNNGLQALCWMLIHSLWQGLLLTIVAGALMLFTRKASAAVRYSLLVVLVGLFLAGCGYTFVYEWNSLHATTTAPASAFYISNVLQHYGIDHWPAIWARYCSDHATVIVTTWFIILCLRCWQMGRGLLYMRRVRVSGIEEPGLYWSGQLNRLAQQLGIRQAVGLLESGITKVPVVIGHWKPVVYMPLGLLANLPPDQVEAVLLHELAHIRRHDFLINLLQYIAETIFFFNPGLLWVSSLVKLEREHCCDDIALQQTQKKKPFLEALVSFKEHALYGAGYVTAFPGTKNQLLQRVTRILQNRNHSLSTGEKAFFFGSLLLTVVLLIAVGNKQVVVHQPAQPAIAAIAVVPVRQVETMLPNKPVVKSKKPVLKSDCPNKLKASKDIRTVALETIPAEVLPPQDPYPPDYPTQVSQLSAVQQTVLRKRQATSDREHAELDRQQAVKDREQAEKDRAQAVIDRKMAERHRTQAMLDRVQADKDREQADLDRAQADIDRLRAEKDRQQATKDREQFERDRVAYKHQ
jgi:bla regulator protein BlaR1